MSRLALPVLLLGAVACGGTEVTVGSGVPLAEAPNRFAAALCERLFSCCDAAELMRKLAVLPDPVPTTEAECAIAYAATVKPFYDQMAADARLVYDPRQMGRCVDAVAATECIDLDVAGDETFERACSLVFDGQVGDGDPCAVPSDCHGAAVCAGVCERRAQEGEDCSRLACDIALFCDTTRTCRETRRNGERCVLATDCQSASCDGTHCVPSGPQACDGV